MHSILKVVLVVFFSLLISVQSEETKAAGTDTFPTILVAPCKSKLSFAEASLIVSVLNHESGAFRGDYIIKINPFTFKNDEGRLDLKISDADAHKMTRGLAVEFSGKAISNKGNKQQGVKGRTDPKTASSGNVSFVVTTADRQIVFNTTYKLVNN